ncbi:PREDICTED: macrophage migration inhibitory factor-like [Papilio polytes]|uniref:macrophage migration inhibitory factor-like n=1 Tax=Papilio polytes TaxID=76194 RepID=UPI0006769422|nr:PREDICTED: macrophage migration inhibitory factor-like [Papilio polytes]
MPCLKILTNISSYKIPRDFLDKIIPVLAKAVKKEDAKFVCVIIGDCQMSFGGETSVPSAIATLESIGNLGPQENKEIVRELTKFLEKEIKVKPDRFFLTFYDLLPYNVAKGGITIEETGP